MTAALVERPRGEVVAVDGSPAMVEAARERLGDAAEVRVADLLELELDRPVDAILSTATFHWIADHDRLFSRLLTVLEPGGRLVAQCGGAGNVAALKAAAERVGEREPFAPALAGWPGPWNFASTRETGSGSSGRLGRRLDVVARRARGSGGSARVPRHRGARLAPGAARAGAARPVRGRGDGRADEPVGTTCGSTSWPAAVRRLTETLALRAFLSHLEHDPAAAKLADEGGSAFVSQSLRAYVIAALADRDVRRPTVVVAGDDRAARDLAQDLRAWLKPRAVRYYPSRGVAYESHLTPPPHLVGLSVAALDALTDTRAGRSSRS